MLTDLNELGKLSPNKRGKDYNIHSSWKSYMEQKMSVIPNQLYLNLGARINKIGRL